MADVDHAVSVSARDYRYTLMSLPPLQAIHGRNVQDSTANLHTIFKGEKKYNNPDNGKIQDGHWCKVCLYMFHIVVLCLLYINHSPGMTLMLKKVHVSWLEAPLLYICTWQGKHILFYFQGMRRDLLCRHESHTKIYIEKCQKLGIATHPWALSKISLYLSDGSVNFN